MKATLNELSLSAKMTEYDNIPFIATSSGADDGRCGNAKAISKHPKMNAVGPPVKNIEQIFVETLVKVFFVYVIVVNVYWFKFSTSTANNYEMIYAMKR